MDTLKELHLKGELATDGYLKETYNESIGDLDHRLTEKGMNEIKQMFKDVKWRQEFIKLAMEEAKKLGPEEGKALIRNALNKVKELS